MNNAGWTWGLFGLSAFGLWLSGMNVKAGWWFAISNQTAWVTYAITTRQWGFLANSIVFVALYARNLWRWRGTRLPQPVKRSQSAPVHDVGGCDDATRASGSAWRDPFGRIVNGQHRRAVHVVVDQARGLAARTRPGGAVRPGTVR